MSLSAILRALSGIVTQRLVLLGFGFSDEIGVWFCGMTRRLDDFVCQRGIMSCLLLCL